MLISILITTENPPDDDLPARVAENIQSFKRAYPDMEHRLFDNDQIRSLIADKFDHEVLKAYDALRPFAFKSDLARLCLLSVFGGIYADLGCFFVQKWAPYELELKQPEPRLWVFGDFVSAAPWDTSQSVVGAPKGHKALTKAIELICGHVKDRYYGPTVLCPTGPTCFGKAVALSCEPEDLMVGFSQVITQDHLPGLVTERSHGFIMGVDVIAVKRKRTTSLQELGITNGNDYLPAWCEKQVYND